MFGECHAHIFMNGVNYRNAVKAHENGVDETIIRAHFQAYKDRGISFVRDGGDFLCVSEKAREIAKEYEIDYRTPVFAIHKRGHYGKIVGRGFSDMKEYEQLVREVKIRGGDFVKIMTTGIMDFDTDGSVTETALPFKEVQEMIHIAHEEGLAVMSHTNGAAAVADAVLAGADSIEHGNYVNEETLKLMAESQVVWVPTVTVVKNMIGCGRFSDEVLMYIWDVSSHNIREGYRYGVDMALGSDAGAYLVPHGQGLWDEWNCFREILGEEESVKQRLFEGEKKIRKKFQKRY